MTELYYIFSMMGLQKDPLVYLQGGYFNKGQILLVWVDISGKGYVEKAKYHSKKKPYVVQSGKVRDWVKLALVAIYYSLRKKFVPGTLFYMTCTQISRDIRISVTKYLLWVTSTILEERHILVLLIQLLTKDLILEHHW